MKKPRRPVKLPQHADAEPLRPGPERLRALARTLLSRLEASDSAALTAFLEQDPHWPFATVCSGSEAPLFAWRGLSEALNEANGKEVLRPEHIFACELNKKKRQWIRAVAPGCAVIDQWGHVDMWDHVDSHAVITPVDRQGQSAYPLWRGSTTSCQTLCPRTMRLHADSTRQTARRCHDHMEL